MKLLILDNYDSFTYNLVYLVREQGVDPSVFRNDKIGPEDAACFDGIILSPGPGIPTEAGNMPAIIGACAGKVPILGVCLGHQAIAEYLGGRLVNMPTVLHGVESQVMVRGSGGQLFSGLPGSFAAGRYHSWEVDPASVPDELEVTANDAGGRILALQNADKKLFGLQFHPESILTPQGPLIVKNFISYCKNHHK